MKTNEKCAHLHQLFNTLERRRFEKAEIDGLGFTNGIYVIFEKGEEAHDVDRIVRIGTTTGQKSTLADRLNEHYENEGRSVFRNNVALCILQKNGDPLDLAKLFWKSSIYRKKWKTTANNEQLQMYQDINEEVNKHIRGSCSFIVFPVEKSSRTDWEAKIISTISSCNNCRSSDNWMGKYSPKDIIRGKGVWNIKHVNTKSLMTNSELVELEKIVELSTLRY